MCYIDYPYKPFEQGKTNYESFVDLSCLSVSPKSKLEKIIEAIKIIDNIGLEVPISLYDDLINEANKLKEKQKEKN